MGGIDPESLELRTWREKPWAALLAVPYFNLRNGMGFMPLKNHKLKPQVAIELVALNFFSCKACAASALLG
jgi:hypothetical protein